MSSKKVASSICCLIFSFYCMQISIVADAADSISQGQNITHSESIVSAGKIFELGFFTPGKSTNYYLGIWYHKISPQTVVWIANRDQPIKSNSPVLTINNEGNLVIEYGKITYKLSESPFSQNTSALLLDSGNLVLRNEKLDILWQSFDYLSHTFLPGMKLGYNKKTGKEWSLTSWRTDEDPSLGTTELRLDPKQQNQFVLMKGSQIFWRSGGWDGNIFSLVPEMRLNYIFNFSLHSDENETYFTYSVKDSTISRLFLDTTGQIKQVNWLEGPQSWFLFWSQPRQICNVYASCGPFNICREHDQPYCLCLHGFRPSDSLNPSTGCERRIPLKCEDGSVSGDEDRFFQMSDVLFRSKATDSTVRTAEECKLNCLSNCTCTAYAYSKESAACSLWYEELSNLKQLPKGSPFGQTLFLKLSASEFQNPEGEKKLIWVIALIVTLVILLLGSGSYIIYQWRKKLEEKEEMERSQDILLFDINMSLGSSMNEFSDGERAKGKKSKDSWLPFFTFSSVSAATDNFSTENKLGEGGFGPVYKGKLLNGQEVAVKRLSRQSGQGLEELKNETILIAKLQHKNLVRLLGCCIENGEKILIYELMPNKSLDSFLFDQAKRGLLDWGTRAKIIEGIAQGLLYLHQYSRFRIIHRDLKASNVLLDRDMNPKISDFGMARMFGGDELQANTNRIVGTYGYMPPEYALQGLFSIKSNVFSFGVVLLETLSSKKNTGFYNTDSLNLLTHAWELWNNDKAQELMDPTLETEATYPMLIKYINVALLCVQEAAVDRPTMSEVVSMLANEHIVLSTPKQPAFSYLKTLQNSVPPKSRPGACSMNNVTLSLIEPR